MVLGIERRTSHILSALLLWYSPTQTSRIWLRNLAAPPWWYSLCDRLWPQPWSHQNIVNRHLRGEWHTTVRNQARPCLKGSSKHILSSGVWFYKQSKSIPRSKVHLNISVAFGGIWAWTELNFTSWRIWSYLGKWSGSLAFCHKGGGKNPNQKRGSKIHEVSTW